MFTTPRDGLHGLAMETVPTDLHNQVLLYHNIVNKLMELPFGSLSVLQFCVHGERLLL